MDVIIEQLKNLAEDFDQNEKRFYRELSESKVSIDLLHAGLTRMERSLNIWKQKLNDMNAHASEFGSLIGNQNQLCGDAEQRYEAAKQKAAEKEAARDAMESKATSMYGELVERVGTVRSEYSNFLSNNGKLRGKKKQNELKVIVGKLEALQSDSNALLNEFRKVNEKYLPSEKFRETADKCRETHKTIYSSYAEAKSLCDGMVASHTVNSKGIRKRLARVLVLVVILGGLYTVVVQGPSKEYKEVVTAAQEGDTDKLLEYLEDHQSTSFKQLRADCAGELADKAYSESVTSITVGEITGSGMNRVNTD